jgi:CBS domain containing-hemolysin-like protein
MNKVVLLTLTLPGLGVVLSRMAVAEGTAATFPALLIAIAVIMILVLLNGLFVAAEFAIIGVRTTQLEQALETGNGRARKVINVLESRGEQDRYIATAQLGITLASIGLAMYGEPQIAHFVEPYLARLWFQPSEELVASLGYYIAIGLLTYLHVVIGEMVPKTLALTDAVKMSLWLAQPMNLMYRWLLYYPVKILNRIGIALLHLFRVPPAEGHARVLSPEEIELLVAESAEGGLLKEEEQEMIQNILDFSERDVEQVMTPRRKVEAIQRDISYDDLLKLVVNSRHSRFPVYEGDRDHIVGVLHLKDLVRHTLRSDGPFDIDLLLRREVPAVPEGYPVERLLAAFKRDKLHMAIVLDEFGGMAGVVTLEDLVEEVVGEVRDEFDQEKEPYVEIAPGIVEVAGNYLVDDFEDGFWGDKTGLPDVETIGGLVVAKLGRPPQVGDEVTYNNWVKLKVLAVDGRAVARVHIEFPDPDKAKPEQENEKN